MSIPLDVSSSPLFQPAPATGNTPSAATSAAPSVALQTPAPSSAALLASHRAASRPPTASALLAPTNAVSLKLPPFWSKDPALWFAQVEAVFATRAITRQTTRFEYVVGALEPEVAVEVRDLILSPPAQQCYDALKATLIRRTETSQQQRLRQLLTQEELGDRTPSQLLRRMQQLLSNAPMDANLLRELFIQRLPSGIQMVLASSTATLPLAQVAEMADRIMEVSPPSVRPATVANMPASAPVPATAASDDMSELRAQVAALTAAVDRLSRSRSSSRSASRSASRSGSPRLGPRQERLVFLP
ncbi:uncharacterized protein LOC135816994 [Sycon ciliatum]|uniref:uncharacterized protein LOC135816994 n=1 Tax=Sycon ciliatum TaxID=27933 RepID=UPI0031F6F603